MTRAVKVENGTIRLPSGIKLHNGIVPQLIPDPALDSFEDRYAAYIDAGEDLPTELSVMRKRKEA